MPRVPLLGRLSIREYFVLTFGTLFIAFEALLRLVIFFLPKPIIDWCYKGSRRLFQGITGQQIKTKERRILQARDFEELCHINGYVHEEHVCLTKDGYLLGLHRLPSKKGQQKTKPGTSTGNPVVYLHHGLLMNSEVWVCHTDAERSLPFVLVEAGYDVWLGNNRGNKYSKKSIHHSPRSTKFWDYSIDDFAWHDIPDTIQYILKTTKAPQLSYIGFSQGTAQAFAALSIHPQLNDQVNVFIALAPAMNPAGLAQPLVDGLMKTSPSLLYLLFGRKAILASAPTWQSILYPPIFTSAIDTSLKMLFNWRSLNITPSQKIAAYAHLYSYASVKSVVHWFQIMRTGEFNMFDDDSGDVMALTSYDSKSGKSRRVPGKNNHSYRPLRFPTRNIVTPIVLLYGDSDSLVDIDTMLAQLPQHAQKNNVTVKRLYGYEHLDILWGKNVHKDVIPEVIEALEQYGSGIDAGSDLDTSWQQSSITASRAVLGNGPGVSDITDSALSDNY